MNTTKQWFATVVDAPADARPVPASRVTVTAIRGAAVAAADSPQVNLAGERIGPTVAHALEAQPNVYLQEPGPSQVSPFLPGLSPFRIYLTHRSLTPIRYPLSHHRLRDPLVPRLLQPLQPIPLLLAHRHSFHSLA